MRPLRRFIQWSDARRAQNVVRILKPWVRGRTLDVGSWDGLVASQLGVDIVGIDVCDPPPNTVIPVQRFNGREIPYGDGEFETVLCCTALHHAEDPAALLAEMLRVGRRLVIMDDSYDTLVERCSVQFLHVISSRLVNMPYQKWGFRSLRGWINFFGEAPCRLLRCERYPGIMPTWVGLRHYLFELTPQRSASQ
jgi:SAM-dependent methyltransferase